MSRCLVLDGISVKLDPDLLRCAYDLSEFHSFLAGYAGLVLNVNFAKAAVSSVV